MKYAFWNPSDVFTAVNACTCTYRSIQESQVRTPIRIHDIVTELTINSTIFDFGIGLSINYVQSALKIDGFLKQLLWFSCDILQSPEYK
jgi:hypothetical protein